MARMSPGKPYWYDSRYWRRVCRHEAGHAVAAMALWDLPAAIQVRNRVTEEGRRDAGGRFTFNKKLNIEADPAHGGLSHEERAEQAMNYLITVAAGGVAEMLRYRTPSKGFAKDQTQINMLKAMQPAFKEALDEETDSRYPQTRRLLIWQRRAFKAIYSAAWMRFRRLRLLGKDFDGVELLTPYHVERLFRENPPR